MNYPDTEAISGLTVCAEPYSTDCDPQDGLKFIHVATPMAKGRFFVSIQYLNSQDIPRGAILFEYGEQFPGEWVHIADDEPHAILR